MDEVFELAKDHSIEITSTGSVVSLRQKYDELKKRREQERKKTLLMEHISQTNEGNLQKKIADMKKLIS